MMMMVIIIHDYLFIFISSELILCAHLLPLQRCPPCIARGSVTLPRSCNLRPRGKWYVEDRQEIVRCNLIRERRGKQRNRDGSHGFLQFEDEGESPLNSFLRAGWQRFRSERPYAHVLTCFSLLVVCTPHILFWLFVSLSLSLTFLISFFRPVPFLSL